MKYVFRPLVWTGARTPGAVRRSRWTFKASWSDTLDLLARELEMLGARDIVIEADFEEKDLRLDGMPRANARQPLFPGVRIAFESKYGPLVYATDTHAFWQHNVRAIALGLQSLRAVDRYGVTKRGEQYTGWKELSSAPAPTQDKAWQTLSELARITPGDDIPSDERIIRLARRYAHPDHGGTSESWQRFDTAYKVVRGWSQ